MPSCAVFGCKSKSGKTKIRLHVFPKNQGLRRTWWNLCKRKDRNCKSYDMICSLHFKLSDYQRDLKSELLGIESKRKLKKDAVPTLQMPVPKQSCLQSETSTVQVNFNPWAVDLETTIGVQEGLFENRENLTNQRMDRLKKRNERKIFADILSVNYNSERMERSTRAEEGKNFNENYQQEEIPTLSLKSAEFTMIKDEEILECGQTIKEEEEIIIKKEPLESNGPGPSCNFEQNEDTVFVKDGIQGDTESLSSETAIKDEGPSSSSVLPSRSDFLPLPSSSELEEVHLLDSKSVNYNPERMEGSTLAEEGKNLNENHLQEEIPALFSRVSTNVEGDDVTIPESTTIFIDEDQDSFPNNQRTIKEENCNKCYKKIQKLSSQLNFYRRKCAALEREHKKPQSKILSRSQLTRLNKNKRTIWSNDDISKALGLREISQKAYIYIKNVYKLPLPCESTLSKGSRFEKLLAAKK